MTNRRVLTLALLGLLAAPVAAQGPAAASRARMPDGHPDLQGFWTAEVAGTYDLTDPRGGEIRVEEVARAAQGVARRPNRSRVVDPPDGRIPYRPRAAAKQRDLQGHANNPTKPQHIDTQNRCLPDGPMRDLLHGGFRILQVPGYVLFLGEENYGYRAIALDGRPHLGADVSLWMGDSRGRWDGDTLVIDVTNLNGKPRLDMVGNFYGGDAHFVERLTLAGPDTLDYEATVDAPIIYTRTWTVAARFRRAHGDDYEMLEDACHEGEQSADKMLLPARPASQPGNGRR